MDTTGIIAHKVGFRAVIPTGQYANIQPEIEFEDVDVESAKEMGMGFIKDLFSKYSEKGNLTEKFVAENTVITESERIESFNENNVVIDFIKSSHQYSRDSVPFIGVTTFIKKFYKEFDSEAISKVSSKSWGVEQDDVKSFWDENRDLTASFGSVVHKALETYDKFKAMGNTISKKKGVDENYALPRHPILKEIVLGFIAMTKKLDMDSYHVVPEALVTDVSKNICGTADRVLIISPTKKICRIQDYKVNIGSEEVKSSLKPLAPFSNLPANKITKYQIQMSVYANMMEKSGWTVEGLDVFIYEKEWVHYKLDVLNVIN